MTIKEENKRDLELLKEINMQEELQRKEMRKKSNGRLGKRTEFMMLKSFLLDF